MARYAKALPYAAIDDLIDYPFQFGEMIRLSAVTHVPVTAPNGDVPWVIYCPCSKLAIKYLNSDNQVCRFQCSCQCHDAFTLLHLFITVTHWRNPTLWWAHGRGRHACRLMRRHGRML
jgi:hypothetical protein